jgi:hypothetical protein
MGNTISALPAQALARARLTGQPVPIPNSDGSPSTLVAYPNGSVGTTGGGFGGSRATQLPLPPQPPSAVAQPVAPSAPFTAAGVAGLPGSPSGPAAAPPALPSASAAMPAVDDYGRPIPTVNVYAQPQQTQPPLNQANPNFTAGIQGLPGSPSGPAVASPGGFPPPHVPDLVVTAQRYRVQHGLATSDDTDALNAESLAAAQAGRTYFNPTLAAQYGQPPPAGVSGPRADVVNALTMPST